VAERVQVLNSSGWRSINADELAAMGADDDEVSVIGIPRHLLKRWWSLAQSDLIGSGFEDVAREIAEYFAYKNWNLPTVPLMEVVGSEDEGDRPLVSSNPMRFGGGVGTLFACINLSDENAAIALDAQASRIRVVVEPGEGLMLPASGVRWSRSTLGDSDLAVTLLIGELTSQ
jgi:hypothetical protein